MKTYFIILLSLFVVASCTMSSTDPESTINVYGLYNSTGGDTLIVSSANNGFLKVRFAYKNPSSFRCTLDSVHVNSDNMTIVWNEYTTDNLGNTRPSVGSGYFSENFVMFNGSFGANPTAIKFQGVKK